MTDECIQVTGGMGFMKVSVLSTSRYMQMTELNLILEICNHLMEFKKKFHNVNVQCFRDE